MILIVVIGHFHVASLENRNIKAKYCMCYYRGMEIFTVKVFVWNFLVSMEDATGLVKLILISRRKVSGMQFLLEKYWFHISCSSN